MPVSSVLTPNQVSFFSGYFFKENAYLDIIISLGDSVQYAAQTLQTKDLHTPDDDHEHHGTTSEQRQYTAHVMEAFIKFVSPNLGQNNASLTVGGFYEMVNALVVFLLV